MPAHVDTSLLALAAAGLAHEGKGPLHTMALHLHLLADKLARLGAPEPGLDRHTTALREGIGKVDSLLRAFADLAEPAHSEPDLGAALERAQVLFGHELRRTGGQSGDWKGPRSVRVDAAASQLGDLVAHAFLAVAAAARNGGLLSAEVRTDERRAELSLRADGGLGHLEEATLHLQAARALSDELKAELSIAGSAAGSARLSISVPRTR
jgi:hypothetical protein